MATEDSGNGAPAAEDAEPKLAISASRQFNAWLAEQELSIGFTTYQAGKVFLIGLRDAERLSVEERTLSRCMGMTATDNSLWITSLYQIWRFENVVPEGKVHDTYDRVFVPKVSYVTGDCDVHDLGVDADGNLIFVNTLFGCLATVSETHSFKPLWRPSFISQLAAEDRCHLNGLAMVDGKAKYVTAVSQSDVADGWRDRRKDGVVVIDVDSNEIVVEGLSMPHSPRFYDGKLWLLDSGTGFSAMWTWIRAHSKGWPSAPVICVECPSTGILRWSAFPSRAGTGLSAGWRWMKGCRSAMRTPGAACMSSI